MARKKAEATEVVEEIKEVAAEAVVEEEKPKRGRKSTKKAEAPVEEIPAAEPEVVEEVKVEEPAAEPEIVAEPEPVVEPEVVVEEPKVEEIKPEPVKEEEKPAKKAEVSEIKSAGYQAIAKTSLYVLRVPGVLNSRIGNYKIGTKFTILEEDRGWGKVADGKWVNLNYIEKL